MPGFTGDMDVGDMVDRVGGVGRDVEGRDIGYWFMGTRCMCRRGDGGLMTRD